jgi:hypothetical protein
VWRRVEHVFVELLTGSPRYVCLAAMSAAGWFPQARHIA